MRKITIIIEDNISGSVYQQPHKRIMNIFANSVGEAFDLFKYVPISSTAIKNGYIAHRIVNIYNEGTPEQKVEVVKDKTPEGKNSDLDPMYGPSPIEKNLDKYWKGLADKYQKGEVDETWNWTAKQIKAKDKQIDDDYPF